MTARAPGLLLLVRRSLRQHLLSTIVTAVSVALATGLTMAVFAIRDQAYVAFTGGRTGFDAVLGARGSQLQLVLNAVFHLETSPGNVPWSLYEAIKADPGVALAIPYAVGDSYEGYRIVGTTPERFSAVESPTGRGLVMEAGRVFTQEADEAVIGSVVARRLGLHVGDEFAPAHGLVAEASAPHDDHYRVVGIMAPTNSPSDRVIWIPIDGVFRMSGHVLRGTGRPYRAVEGAPIPEEHREVSAVMLTLADPQAGFFLSQRINGQGKVATLAWPIGRVVAELFDRIGWITQVLALVAYLVVAVAAGSVLASIYNTMNERRREFAILRALGARRAVVSLVIVLEAATITALGVIGGGVVYLGILAVARAVIRAQTGVVLDVLAWHPALWMTPVALLALGALAGLVPAWKAYRTDVADHLSPTS